MRLHQVGASPDWASGFASALAAHLLTNGKECGKKNDNPQFSLVLIFFAAG